MAYKIQGAAYAMSFALDCSLSHRQRASAIVTQMDLIIAVFSENSLSDMERVKISRCRLVSMLLLILQIDVEDPPSLLLISSLPPISQEEKEKVLAEVRKLDATQSEFVEGIPCQIVAQFTIQFMTLVVYWRSGESEQAFAAALKVAEILKQYTSMLVFWHLNVIPLLALLPYYFKVHNAKEISDDVLIFLNNAFAKVGNYNDAFKQACSQMNMELVPDNIAQIEQELLCETPLSSSLELDLFSIPSLPNFDFVCNVFS